MTGTSRQSSHIFGTSQNAGPSKSPGGRRSTSHLHPAGTVLWAGPAPFGYPGTSPGSRRAEATYRPPTAGGTEIVLAAPAMVGGAAFLDVYATTIAESGIWGNIHPERVPPVRA